MLTLLETLKDCAESTFDSATARVENVHGLIGGYVDGQLQRLRHGERPVAGSSEKRVTVYDVIRGVNREIGEFGTDIFEIVDDARARRLAEKRSDRTPD